MARSKVCLRNERGSFGYVSTTNGSASIVPQIPADRIYTGEKVIVKLKPMVRSIHGSGLKLDKLKEMLERRQEVEFAVVEFYRRDNSVISKLRALRDGWS